MEHVVALDLSQPRREVPYGGLRTRRAMGPGASDIISKVTLNIGTIDGGLKVNMVPGECRFEADIRLPVGVAKETVMAEVKKIAAQTPEASFEEIN